jgi:hypothetical protein
MILQCDKLEKFGLVDYEMGVWEEEIIRSKQPAVTSEYQISDYDQW